MNSREFRQAAADGNLGLVKQLHAKGGDINAVGEKSGKTALHWAAQYGRIAVGAFLVTKGANINAQDSDGNTIIHITAEAPEVKLINKIQIITYLLEKKADVLKHNNAGTDVFMSLSNLGDKNEAELMQKIHLNKAMIKVINLAKALIYEYADSRNLAVYIAPNGKVKMDKDVDKILDEHTKDGSPDIVNLSFSF